MIETNKERPQENGVPPPPSLCMALPNEGILVPGGPPCPQGTITTQKLGVPAAPWRTGAGPARHTSCSAGVGCARSCMLMPPCSVSKPWHEACPGPKGKGDISSPASHPHPHPKQAEILHQLRHSPTTTWPAQPHVMTAAASSSCTPPSPPHFLSFSNKRAKNRNPEASLGLHPSSITPL